jgi:hypothetical protein
MKDETKQYWFNGASITLILVLVFIILVLYGNYIIMKEKELVIEHCEINNVTYEAQYGDDVYVYESTLTCDRVVELLP